MLLTETKISSRPKSWELSAIGSSLWRRLSRKWLLILPLLLLQLLDGALTFQGVGAHGISVEGNPLVAYLMQSVGVVAALLIVKFSASFLILFVALVSDTVSWAKYALCCVGGAYFFGAVVPWILLLNFV